MVDGISLRSLRLSTAQPSPVTPLDGLQIGNHSCATLLQSVQDNIGKNLHMFKDMWEASSGFAPTFNGGNAFMSTVLYSVQEALKKYGVHLTAHDPLPENIGALVHASAQAAAAVEGFEDQPLRPQRPVADIDLQVEALQRLQQKRVGKDSPFDKIEPRHRWRMCVDPSKVQHATTHLGLGRDNPLLPFLFDTEKAFLSGVMNAWDVSMESLHKPLTADLVIELYKASFPLGLSYDIDHKVPGTHFWLTLGRNMTEAGKQQLLENAVELRKHLDNYAVVGSQEDLDQFKADLLDTDLDEAVPKVAVDKKALLFRGEMSKQSLDSGIGHFLGLYARRCQADPQGKNQVRHITELCQNLEQFHPFPDGNCRSFGIILLNHLLARHGLPLSMLEDPNWFDGWSLDELVAKVKEGQQRVAEWNTPDKSKRFAPLRQAADLKAKLNGLFKGSITEY